MTGGLGWGKAARAMAMAAGVRVRETAGQGSGKGLAVTVTVAGSEVSGRDSGREAMAATAMAVAGGWETAGERGRVGREVRVTGGEEGSEMGVWDWAVAAVAVAVTAMVVVWGWETVGVRVGQGKGRVVMAREGL